MIFTTKAEYGVRLLIQLGLQGGAHPVSLKAVAEAENLPLAYLERIAGPAKHSAVSAIVIVVLGCCAVLALDAAGARRARWIGFSYALLTPASLIVYAATGFLAAQCRANGRRHGRPGDGRCHARRALVRKDANGG